MGIKIPESPESWKAFWVMGVLFPLHIVLGLLSVPYWVYHLYMRSITAWVCAVIYMPFYLSSASTQHPGWKGAEGMWSFMDYAQTGKSYFGDFAVHGEENVDNKQGQYIIACHPHGTVIFQRTFWRSELLDKVFQNPAGWRMIAASVLFYIPIVREMTLFFGAVDACKPMCEKVLRSGTSLVLYPGGLDEANSTEGRGDDVRICTRTGFIRLAIKYGIPVLPVFTFGELDCVTPVNILPAAIASWIKKALRMSTTLFIGRYFTFIPLRVPFNLCIGKKIEMKTGIPDDGPELDAEIARVHQEYKAELRRLYETNKKRFGYLNRQLVFTCELKKSKSKRL